MQKSFRGKVIRGDGIAGRDYDTPSANLDLDVINLDAGVYAALCEYDGKTYQSAVYYGVGDPPKFEVHILDFSGDLLGETLSVHLVSKVSEHVPWESQERMRQKILHDIELTRQAFEQQEKN